MSFLSYLRGLFKKAQRPAGPQPGPTAPGDGQPTGPKPVAAPARRPLPPREEGGLRQWAYFEDWPGMLEGLAAMALDGEPWTLPGGETNGVLANYMKQTFLWFQSGRGVAYSKDKRLAAFNTGLFDKRFYGILAVFKQNRVPDRQPYKFEGFCTQGEGPLGQTVSDAIGRLARPNHFRDPTDRVYLDPTRPIDVNWAHVIVDGIKRGRLPVAFLRAFWPGKEADLAKMDFIAERFGHDRGLFARVRAGLKSRIDDALKRVLLDNRVAVPTWYPALGRPSFLLPLCLADPKKADAALVVEQRRGRVNGYKTLTYKGHTVLTLEMAYTNARLTCRPGWDWLNPLAFG